MPSLQYACMHLFFQHEFSSVKENLAEGTDLTQSLQSALMHRVFFSVCEFGINDN